ncbi:MAG: acyl-CoA dehydrogenase [Halieaceae bacterium]|nr:acyl-CoA dehydrogenase [Halieaceae bacterium]
MNRVSALPETQRELHSLLDPWPAAALHASLGLEGEAPGLGLPLLWHWLYFLEAPQRELEGADGHPRTGSFFPAIEQPRRMFVGARCQLHRKLQLQTPARLVESVLGREEKQGSAGAMTLLTVDHRYYQRDELCIEEQRDFMYLPAREDASDARFESEPVPIADGDLALDIDTDPVLLFKFSALTFNGHRIHYDADYARDIEGYPAPVVHGPLTALLLADLAAAANPVISRFAFRARAPLFCGDRLRLRGTLGDQSISLAAYRPDGAVAMTAEAEE